MKKEKHVHKFQRVRLGDKGYTVYKCMQPGCPTFYRVELVMGQITKCWRCGQDVIMTQGMAKQFRPHCASCTRSPNSGSFKSRRVA